MAGEATIGSAFIQLIPSTEGIGSAVGKALGGSEVASAATKAGEDAGGALAGGFGKVIGGVAIGASAVGVAAAGVGAGLLKLGSTFDDAFDSIQVKTGATGTTLDGLKDTFKTTFADGPAAADDVATAIGSLNQKLGLTGQPLGDLSKQVLDLSRITGTDLNSNIKGVTDTFLNWGVAAADQGNFLDDLFRTSQKTGVGVDVLSGQMADNGVVLRQSGLDFDQAAVFLGTLAKGGIDAADVMPALSKSLASAAKDGKSAKDVLNDTFNAIKNAPNDTAAASVAMDVFGARAGPKLAASIREGKVSLTDLNTDIAGVGDGIEGTAASTADFPEKFGTAMNKAKVALEPLATKVFSFVGDMADKFGNVLPGILDKLGPIFSSIGDAVGPVLETIVGAVTAFFKAFAAGDGDVTSSGLAGTFEKIANAARSIFDAIVAIDWKSVFSEAVNFITPVVSAIQDLAGSIVNFAVSAFQTLRDLIVDNQDTLKALGDKLIEVGSFIRDVLNGAIKILSDTFQFLSDHMEAVKAVLVPLLVLFGTYETIMGVISVATGAYAVAQGIATAAVGLFNAVLALNPIVLVVAALAALVAGLIYAYTHFDTFRAIVDGFWQVIQTVFHWIEDNWQTLLAILTGPIGVAVLIITKNWDTIKDGVSAMVDFVKGLINDFVNIFIKLPIDILNAIGNFAALLIQKGIDLIAGLVNGYIGAYSLIIGEVVQLGGKILGWIGNFASVLVGKGIELIQGFVQGIYNGEAAILGYISGLGGKIAGWIGNLSGYLISAGEDIIRGLITGMGNMVGAAVQKVKDVASSIVNGAKSFLGIGSPSKVFHEIGINVGEGLVNGIDEMNNAAQKAGQTLGAAAVTAASAPLTFASAGSPSLAGRSVPGVASAGLTGPSTVVNLNQTNHTDATPDQIAQATTFKLATAGVAV